MGNDLVTVRLTLIEAEALLRVAEYGAARISGEPIGLRPGLLDMLPDYHRAAALIRCEHMIERVRDVAAVVELGRPVVDRGRG